MKFIIILLLLLSNIAGARAQNERNTSHSREYYLLKSNRQNTSGSILLITGIFCATMGLLSNDEGGDAFGPSPAAFGAIVGAFFAVPSVYLKIRSKKWKAKAAELSAGAIKIPGVKGSMAMQPALVLRLKLN